MLARERCRLFGWRFKWRQMLRIPATQDDVEAALLEGDREFRQSDSNG
jgi:hypothetical protein